MARRQPPPTRRASARGRAKNAARSATERVAAREASRWGELLPPWILGGILAIGTGAAWIWGVREPQVRPLLPVAVLFVTVVASTAVHAFMRERRGPVLALGHASSGGTGLLIAAALIWGPLTYPIPLVSVAVYAALCIAWNVRKAPSLHDQAADSIGSDPQGLEAILADAGVPKTRWSAKHVDKDRASGEGLVPQGATVSELQRVAPRIESHLGAPPGSMSVVPDGDNARKFRFRITRRDLLKKPITLRTADLILPRTPFDPIPIGLYQTGEIATVTLADEDGARHILIAGMTGAGKSDGAVLMAALTAHIPDLGWIAVDASKGRQTFAVIGPTIEWLCLDKASGTAALRTMKQVITDRANHLGDRRMKQWQPGCGLSYVVVLIEEASDWTDSEYIEDLAMKARSAGITMILSLQHPSYKWIEPGVRSQFGTRLCFGVDGDTPEGFMLDNEVIEAGARPGLWKNSKPGYAILDQKGLPLDERATALRTYRLSPDHRELEEIVRAYPASGLDPVTARALGDVYAEAVRARGGALPLMPTAGPEPVHDDDARAGAPHTEEDDDMADDHERTEEELLLAHAQDDALVPAQAPGRGDPPTGLDALPQRMDRPTTAQARAALLGLLRQAAERGVTVSAATLMSGLVEFAASRSFVYKLLAQLQEEPVDGVMVEQTEDGYRPILAGQNATAGV
ncbi:MAG: hypothetical protein ACRCZP_11295 [Phycicoccus sp.]